MAICSEQLARAADHQAEEREPFAITFHAHVASAYQGRADGHGCQTGKVPRG